MAISLGAVERELAALPETEKGTRRELLERIAAVVVSAPLDRAAALVGQIADAEETHRDDDAGWSLAEARANNVARVLADQAQLIRECIPARLLRDGMNVSRQRLHQLIAERRLIAIQLQEGSPNLFPFWQFMTGMPVRPIDGLGQLLDAAEDAGIDAIQLHFFMVEPNDRLNDHPPYEALSNGDLEQVLRVLRSAGMGPF